MNITSGQRSRTVDEQRCERPSAGGSSIKLKSTPRTLSPAGVAVYELPIDKIKAGGGARADCAPESIAALAQSIHKYGVIHPLTVRTDGIGGEYELVSGHRRLRAAKLLGLRSVRCIVITRDRSQADAISLCENIHTDGMHYLDIAEGIGRLCTRYGYSISGAASKLCLSERYVADKVSLLSLTDTQRRMIREGGLCEEQAVLLLSVEDAEAREKLIAQIITRRLDRWGSEALVYSYLKKRSKKEKNRTDTYLIRDIRIFYNTIDRALDVMRSAGYPILAEKQEREEHTVITIRIPR